ncbi:SdiA-regulated domain-containing protein [Luteirhabdus pelagi]|uniref:SdiA-regulated domain-containing protein n=1 Tax=Luteirhabdus pelagi TaxID=2792783 RepID=UPI00193A6C61|nr:SdiA-regulated domain-containing protein [Luteirhabdus pelagi]
MDINKKIIAFSFGTLAFLVIAITFAFTVHTFKKKQPSSKDYTIKETWELPAVLDEISGIAWLSEGTIASIQDEDGIIFIYDLNKKKIIEEIEFAGPGDYEGIAIHNQDAYVLRSDGTIYIISNFRNENKKVETFTTKFTAKNNMETLTLDAKKDKLIIAPKDRDSSDDFKGLYEIELISHRMNAEPSVRIMMEDEAFKDYKKKKIYKTFNPSDAAVHPNTGEYYVLEGKNPKLVILDSDGTIKKVHKLDEDTFAQPEGITFSSDATLYISNEVGDNDANIMQVTFN